MNRGTTRPIDSEALESRRLMAGTPVHHGGGFGPPHGPGHAGVFVPLFSLRPMVVISDGTTTVAAAMPAADTAVPKAATYTLAAAMMRTADVARVPVAGNAARPVAVAVRTDAAEPVARQVTHVDVDAPAASPARPSAAVSPPADAGLAFGPFVVAAEARPSAPATGLASVLARNKAERGPRPTSTETQAPAGRTRVAATIDADADTAGPDLTPVPAVAEVAIDQASLAVVPVDVQSLWQRWAVATAGATLVAANWIVRRRQAKAAMAMTRR